jgi:hypothetical protein
VLRARNAGESRDAEARRRLERSPSWGWTALAPKSQLLLGVDVGRRPRALAPRVGPQGRQGVAPDGVPRCLPAGLKDAATAVLPPCGHGRPPARRQDQGPLPPPRWRPRPRLRDAPVVQSYRRRRLVGGTPRVVCGPRLASAQVVVAWGWTMNTAGIARLTLASRQRVAARGRRVPTLCQGAAGGREPVALCQVAHPFVVPHARVRQRVLGPAATPGEGSPPLWRPCTPAMAAGVTEHIWSLQAGRRYRVPPWPHPQGRSQVVQEAGRAVARDEQVESRQGGRPKEGKTGCEA